MITEGDSLQHVAQGAVPVQQGNGSPDAGPMIALARRARHASRVLAQSSSSDRDKALWAAAAALREMAPAILEANARERKSVASGKGVALGGRRAITKKH